MKKMKVIGVKDEGHMRTVTYEETDTVGGDALGFSNLPVEPSNIDVTFKDGKMQVREKPKS